jgi:hypothetical protein
VSDGDASSIDAVRHLFRERAFGSGEGQSVWIGRALGRTGVASPVDAHSLLTSARRHAARGMRARAAGEPDDASLQLGIMLEHLAKAYLASLHPTLLADNPLDFLSLARLAGQGQRVTPGHSLRTVGLQVALQRIGILQNPGNKGTATAFAKRFELVLEARNGVAHIGDDGGVADSVAQTAVQGADELLQLMGHSLDEVFGDYTAAARSLLDEHATAVHQLVTLLIARAKRTFNDQYPIPHQEEQAAELRAMDRMTMRDPEHEPSRHAAPCPACGHVGTLSGSPILHVEPVEPGTDPAGITSYLGDAQVEVTVALSADSFRCPICGLRLQGREQLDEAKMPTQVPGRPAVIEDVTDYFQQLASEYDSADEDPGTEP